MIRFSAHPNSLSYKCSALVVLSTVESPATSLNRPLFLVPADSPYIHSYFNLSTTTTSAQQQRPLKLVPTGQNNLSTKPS